MLRFLILAVFTTAIKINGLRLEKRIYLTSYCGSDNGRIELEAVNEMEFFLNKLQVQEMP
jgi:hypothetical protein